MWLLWKKCHLRNQVNELINQKVQMEKDIAIDRGKFVLMCEIYDIKKWLYERHNLAGGFVVNTPAHDEACNRLQEKFTFAKQHNYFNCIIHEGLASDRTNRERYPYRCAYHNATVKRYMEEYMSHQSHQLEHMERLLTILEGEITDAEQSLDRLETIIRERLDSSPQIELPTLPKEPKENENGTCPVHVEFSSDGKHTYITNSTSGAVSVIRNEKEATPDDYWPTMLNSFNGQSKFKGFSKEQEPFQGLKKAIHRTPKFAWS